MRNAIIATGVSVSVLALATAASAQEAAPTISRHITIEAELRAIHDSNVARSSAAIAEARGIERSDWIIMPSLNANILLPVSRQSLFLRGSIGHEYYQRNDVLSAGHYDLIGGVNLNIGLCQGVADIGYQQHQSDLQDLGVLATKNIEKQTTGGLTLTCGRSAGLAPTASIRETKATNSADVLENTDYNSTTYMVGLAYRRPSFGTLTLYGEHVDTEYDNRLVLNGAGDLVTDGYQTDAIGMRYERRLGARIGGEVEIAYTTLDPESVLAPKADGATYRAVVDFRASSRLNTSLRLSRDVQPTIRQGAAYEINQGAELTAVYGIGSRIKVNAGLSHDDNRYKGITIPGQISKETIDAIFAGARWDVGRRIALLGDLRHEERDANVAGFDYSSTQVGISVIGKF